jgi:metal-sulfur cluster biosynthetic enzyme
MADRVSKNIMEDDILRVLNEIEDPELGIGIVDLGLIYRAEWTERGIEVDLTTTSPSCPFSEWLHEQTFAVLHQHFGEASAICVRLVSDPPWLLGRLSQQARRALGWVDSTETAMGIPLHYSSDPGRWKH